jgi:hypothetical protein
MEQPINQPIAGTQPPMGGQPMAMGGQPPMGMPPAPSMATPPMMADGGAVIKRSGGFKEFFEDVNILDVTISAFIVASVLYTVHYYRYMMLLEKSGYQDLSARLGKIESAVIAKKAEMNASGNMRNNKRRPVMRLG